jgi:hypothetical protein
MKNLIIAIGAILVVFNTLVGLIISGYEPFNYLLVNVSIILTTGLIYLLAASKIDNGFKIGLAFLFTLAGIARAVCCVVQPQSAENNVLLIAVVGILLFEIACFAAASFAGKNG